MNRRDFLAVSAAACVLPAIPAVACERPVRVFCDGEGETYVAHDLDELLRWLRRQVGVPPEQVDPADEWREISDWEASKTLIGDEEGPDRLLSEIVAEYRAGGLTVPEQIATTYC